MVFLCKITKKKQKKDNEISGPNNGTLCSLKRHIYIYDKTSYIGQVPNTDKMIIILTFPLSKNKCELCE